MLWKKTSITLIIQYGDSILIFSLAIDDTKNQFFFHYSNLFLPANIVNKLLMQLILESSCLKYKQQTGIYNRLSDRALEFIATEQNSGTNKQY
jgi:hypothetical protein